MQTVKIINSSKKAVVLLHGYGANMQDLAPLAQIVDSQQEYDWFFPDAPLNAQGMPAFARAWFPIDIERIQRAALLNERYDLADYHPPELNSSLAQCEEFFAQNLDVYDEIILGGFSQGGMMALHCYPLLLEKVSKLVLLSTCLLSESTLTQKLKDVVAPIPVLFAHGTQDPVIPYETAKNLAIWLSQNEFPLEFISHQGGHEIPLDVLKKISSFLGGSFKA